MISTSEMKSLNKIFCIIGPSGAGKTAACKLVPLPSVVSYRTRGIRAGEIDGVDGHFISKKQFLEMKEQDLWIAETEYAGNYYGATQGELLELEDSPMLYIIDWPGIESFKKALYKVQGYSPEQIVTIFIHTTREDLETRMKVQGRPKEEIKVRLDRADRDYASSSRCDYVVTNKQGEIKETAYEIMNIILKETYR